MFFIEFFFVIFQFVLLIYIFVNNLKRLILIIEFSRLPYNNKEKLLNEKAPFVEWIPPINMLLTALTPTIGTMNLVVPFPAMLRREAFPMLILNFIFTEFFLVVVCCAWLPLLLWVILELFRLKPSYFFDNLRHLFAHCVRKPSLFIFVVLGITPLVAFLALHLERF